MPTAASRAAGSARTPSSRCSAAAAWAASGWRAAATGASRAPSRSSCCNLSLLDQFGRERFRREGTVLARLTHGNIARLIDAGVTEEGQPYLVLEHVEGRRIDAFCEEQRLSPARRIELFLQVLAAVGHAHASLVVHRDLKPSNVLVTAEGRVKLLDFGIAKLLESESAPGSRTALTDQGGLAMTPEYAAPEQVAGDTVTTATDVYSLGVMLYVLLAGRHPTGEGSRSAAEHIRGILDTEPPQLSAAAEPKELRRLYTGDLDNVLAKALQKDPARRYPTVTALADDLVRHLHHEPVSARPASFGYRAGRFIRRHRAAVVAGSVAAAALIGATVAATSQMLEARRQRALAEAQRDEARAQRDKARYEEQRATASSEFMRFFFESIGPGGKPFTMQELLERARATLESDYRGDPRFVARMLTELADDYFALSDRERESALLARANQLATATDDPETVAYTECSLGQMRAANSEATEAQRDLDRATRYLARVREPSVRLRSHCLRARSTLDRVTGQLDSALVHASTAVGLTAAAGDTSSELYQSNLNELLIVHQASGRLDASLDVVRRSIDVLERNGRANTLSMANEKYNEAILLSMLGEKLAARDRLDDAMDLARGMDSSGSVPVTMTLMRGDLERDLGSAAAAEAILERGLALARKEGDRPSVAWGLSSLARAEIAGGRLAQARVRMNELSKLTINSAKWQLGLLRAELASAEGRWGESHRLFVDHLATYGFPERRFHWPHYAKYIAEAAEAAWRSGDPIAADSLARHALRFAQADGQEETRSGVVGSALVTLARARLADGDAGTANEIVLKAVGALGAGYGPGHARTREARTLLDSLATLVSPSHE